MGLHPVDAALLAGTAEQRWEAGRRLCRALEAGEILYFARSPLQLPAGDKEFLLRQKQTAGRHHKNIAFKPGADRLSGYAGEDGERMRAVMQRFSQAALELLAQLLPPYRMDADFASFRGLEEQGRKLAERSRNDLLHVDSFPTRPTHGKRILRFFININPAGARVWRTGPPFPELARQYAAASGLLRRATHPGLAERLGELGHPRPAYDRFMLAFHHWLKANAAFQAAEHPVWEFPSGSAWICLTDTVSHAVLRGQYALEQTVMVRTEGLQAPDLAPVAVFEALARAGRQGISPGADGGGTPLQ